MNLVRYNPNRRVSSRSNRGTGFFDELFDDFLTPFAVSNHRPVLKDNLGLPVDIYEKDDLIVIEADLPGVEKDAISVDVQGKYVTLSGERKSEEEVKDESSFRRERRYGKLERTFSLPFEVKSNNVKANFNNGVLKLEISKPEEQVAKKIDIN